MQLDVAIEVEAPPAALWAAVAEVEAWPQWTASMRAVAWLDGATLALGSRARVEQPGTPALIWTVSELDVGRSFTWRNDGPGLSNVGAHVVEPLPAGGSRLRLGLKQTGALAPLVGLLTGARTRRYVQMELEGLKRAAEASVA